MDNADRSACSRPGGAEPRVGADTIASTLDLALAGPRRYANRTIQDHWMGDGRRDANAGDITAALALLDRGWWLLFAAVLAIAVVW